MPIWNPKSVSLPLTEDRLRDLLKRYDTNGDDKLSKEEQKAAFRSLGVTFSGWRAGRALCHADANEDGYINEKEMNELVKYDFEKYNKNRDLKLSKEELKEAFKYQEAYIPRWKAWRGFQVADTNGDGFITRDEINKLSGYTIN